MMYFESRSKAREFAHGSKKIVDLGAGLAKRWAVKVV
jgi:hypothetical protein